MEQKAPPTFLSADPFEQSWQRLVEIAPISQEEKEQLLAMLTQRIDERHARRLESEERSEALKREMIEKRARMLKERQDALRQQLSQCERDLAAVETIGAEDSANHLHSLPTPKPPHKPRRKSSDTMKTTKDAAEYLGIAPRTLIKLRDKGKIACEHLSEGAVGYRVAELNDYLERQRSLHDQKQGRRNHRTA